MHYYTVNDQCKSTNPKARKQHLKLHATKTQLVMLYQVH